MIYSQKGTLELYKKIPIDSYLRQFIDLQRIDLADTGANVRDTNNTLRAVTVAVNKPATAPAANHNYGLEVGTGTNAVTISDYALQTKIATGSGAGQLNYQATTVNAVIVAGSQAYFTVTRNFNNNSGNTITVQEAGLALLISTWCFLIIRDLTGAIDVLNTKTLAAQYTIQVTA